MRVYIITEVDGGEEKPVYVCRTLDEAHAWWKRHQRPPEYWDATQHYEIHEGDLDTGEVTFHSWTAR